MNLGFKFRFVCFENEEEFLVKKCQKFIDFLNPRFDFDGFCAVVVLHQAPSACALNDANDP